MNWNRVWVLGRRSEFAYVRVWPNPGFMVPIWPGKRLRWSRFYGGRVTKPPAPGNPKGH